MKEANLELPRGEITHNAFVLWPLAEIAPNTIHPLEHKPLADLWEGFDKTEQALWPVEVEDL